MKLKKLFVFLVFTILIVSCDFSNQNDKEDPKFSIVYNSNCASEGEVPVDEAFNTLISDKVCM